MGAIRAHEVVVEFRGATNVRTDRVLAIDLVSDMLELADQFTVTVPWSAEMQKATVCDAEVLIYIDGAPVLDGFVDERRRDVDRGQAQILVGGRDKGGRLVDESAPLITLYGLSLLELGKAMCGAWFPSVVLSNERNRKLLGRGARQAMAGVEPIVGDPQADRRVTPGESRANVLTYFLERAGCLGWSSGDGKEFVIGQPNHTQAPQWLFFHAKADSKRTREANVSRFMLTESVAERYSRIRVVGSSRGLGEPATRRPRGAPPPSTYGRNVTQRLGVSLANTTGGFAALLGAGGNSDFLREKSLTIADDEVRTAEEATARADREMLWRNSRGRELVVTVPGFGQSLGTTGAPAIYRFDKVARFEDEDTGEAGEWFVTRVAYHRSKDDGETTDLTMVPRGTPLRVS